MAKSTPKKSAPISEAEYKPSLYLDGKNAKGLQGAPVGKKVKVLVDAVVTSQSQSRGYDGQLRHSTSLEINRMKPQSSKPAPKRKK